MSENSEDMALDALLAARSEIAPELNTEIVLQAYAIERAHQFEDAREMPLKRLQKLVEDLVATSVPL